MRSRNVAIFGGMAFALGIAFSQIFFPRTVTIGPLAEPSYFPPYLYQMEGITHCASPDSSERERLEIAVRALETANLGFVYLRVGAERGLGGGLFRHSTNGRSGVRICLPDDLAVRVGKSIEDRKLLDGHIGETEVMLASVPSSHSDYVVKQIAKAAFDPSAPSPRNFDHRLLARTVLASFGSASHAYGARAFKEVNVDGPFGTTAAQISAAAHVPGALDKIDTLIKTGLAAIPEDKPIPLEIKERLYDLALAIYFAGPEAKNHIGSIEAIMTRKVESWAPPYGMISMPAEALCILVERIQISELKKFPYCKNGPARDS